MSPPMHNRQPDHKTKLDHVDVSYVNNMSMEKTLNTLNTRYGLKVENYSVTLAIFYLVHRLLVINGIPENNIPQRVVKMHGEEHMNRGATFEKMMCAINEKTRDFIRHAIARVASATRVQVNTDPVSCPVDGVKCLFSNVNIDKGQECNELILICDDSIYTYYFMPHYQEKIASIVYIYRMEDLLSKKFKDEKYKDFLAVHNVMITDDGIKLACLYITSTEDLKSWFRNYSLQK